MSPVFVDIQPPPSPANTPAADTQIEFVADLDTYVEHSMCSCNAGDDKPYYQARRPEDGTARQRPARTAARPTVG